jgi:hypothetical protein
MKARLGRRECWFGLIVAFSLTLEAAGKPMPVYIYLFSHYQDHINLEPSEWRIKEVMRILSDAQFLRLMAEAYQGNVPSTLRVKPSNILPSLSPLWKRAHRVYEETPAAYSYLQLWTVKPAQFKEAMRT